MNRLADKVALVTGAASGIGAACCRAMAANGAAIAVTDINQQAGEALVASLTEAGAKAKFYPLDATKPEQWDYVIKAVSGDFGGLHIVVNNAGIAIVGNIEDTTLEDWNKTILINQTSVFIGTQKAVLYMKEHNGGSIVNISSIEGIVGNSLAMAYNASKGAVRLLSKSAALHCGQQKYNIRVNSVHPGFVRTPMIENAFSSIPKEVSDMIVAAHPIGRIAEVEEVANGVVFLASDESSFVTGSELVIDGGYTAQ